MKLFFAKILILLAITNVYSQSKKDIAHKIGFEYFAMKDTFAVSPDDSELLGHIGSKQAQLKVDSIYKGFRSVLVGVNNQSLK